MAASAALTALLTRRTRVLNELAALDRTKPGGLPNRNGDAVVDHVGYRKSLYEELKEIDAAIARLETTEAIIDETDGVFEIDVTGFAG